MPSAKRVVFDQQQMHGDVVVAQMVRQRYLFRNAGIVPATLRRYPVADSGVRSGRYGASCARIPTFPFESFHSRPCIAGEQKDRYPGQA